jgi:hypothetical protein
MNHDEAKKIAQQAWDEAVAAAPPTTPFEGSWAKYYIKFYDHYSFIAGYLKESIVSLLQDHAKPRLVSMDDRVEEPVEIKLLVVVSGNYQPSERATRDYPGCPEGFTIESIFIGGLELPGEIQAFIEREYGEELQEAILERRAVLRHDMEGV